MLAATARVCGPLNQNSTIHARGPVSPRPNTPYKQGVPNTPYTQGVQDVTCLYNRVPGVRKCTLRMIENGTCVYGRIVNKYLHKTSLDVYKSALD